MPSEVVVAASGDMSTRAHVARASGEEHWVFLRGMQRPCSELREVGLFDVRGIVAREFVKRFRARGTETPDPDSRTWLFSGVA